MRVRAWLFASGTVHNDDLKLLAYLGETLRETDLLRAEVPTLLGGFLAADWNSVKFRQDRQFAVYKVQSI